MCASCARRTAQNTFAAEAKRATLFLSSVSFPHQYQVEPFGCSILPQPACPFLGLFHSLLVEVSHLHHVPDKQPLYDPTNQHKRWVTPAARCRLRPRLKELSWTRRRNRCHSVALLSNHTGYPPQKSLPYPLDCAVLWCRTSPMKSEAASA